VQDNPFAFVERLVAQRNGDGRYPTSTAITDLLKLCADDDEFRDALAEYRRHWREARKV
jgi:hypothetical protein